MGNCYSNQGRQSHHVALGSDAPRPLSKSANSLHSDSGALSFLHPYEIDEGMESGRIHTAPPYSKSRPSTHRGFGFRAPSSRAALAKARASNESLDSEVRISNVSLDVETKTAYIPKDQKTWLMIDDESRSMSLKSGDSANNKLNRAKLAEDDIMNANVKEDNLPRAAPSRLTKLPQPGGVLPKRAGPRGPLAKFADSHYGSERSWAKATAHVDKTEVKSKVERKDAKATSVVAPARVSLVVSSQKVKEISDKKETPKGKKSGFLKRGFFKKSKSAPTNVENEAVPEAPEEPSVEDEVDHRFCVAEIISDKESKEEDSGNRQLEEEITMASLVDLVSMAPSIAPMASVDGLETASVGSIDSDDLMLDLDIGLDDIDYEEKQTERSRSNSGRYKFRSRSRSQTNDDLEDPVPRSSLQRQDSVNKVGSGNLHKECIVESPCEALDELASLLDNNPLLRRTPRLSKASRPCSFPGPRQIRPRSTDAADEPIALSLKPPRETPSFGDEEVITMDGFTYRQLLQDIRTYKTMLLKLKRIIQQEEIGLPWKNGLMFPGSNPNSPCQEEVYRPLVGESPTTDKGLFDDLTKENLDLKEQNCVLNKEREVQERTIKLLQQQMEILGGHKNGKNLPSTKYECGHLGPGGKAFTNATVQTDRALPARLPRYDSRDTAKTTDTTVAPPAGSRPRGELRSNPSVERSASKTTQRRPLDHTPSAKPSQLKSVPPRSKSINEAKFLKSDSSRPTSRDTTSTSDLVKASKSFDVVPKTQQRPLSTGSAIAAQKSSKLPGLRVHRYKRTEAHQLRSFSNITKQQPPS